MSAPSERLIVDSLSAGFFRHLVLTNLTLSAQAGEVIAIRGENGSGKTTLARVLAGLHPVAAGRVQLDGRDITFLSPWRRVSLGLKHVPQGDRVFRELTVAQNVRLLGGEPRNGTAARQLPGPVANAAWVDYAWQRPAGNLSGGRQALVALGAAVASAGGLLLLDEPAAELDDEMVEIAAQLVREAGVQGTTVLVFEHRRAFSRLVANRELSLADGCLH